MKLATPPALFLLEDLDGGATPSVPSLSRLGRQLPLPFMLTGVHALLYVTMNQVR